MEYNILIISIYAGFMMIVIAPVLRLFSKAGIKSWKSLLPGYNIISWNIHTNQKINHLSFFAIIATVYFLVVYGFFNFQGDIGLFFGALFMLLIVLFTLCMSYFFPMISTVIFFIIAFFGSMSVSFSPTFVPVVLLLLAIGMWQLLLDILHWLSLLKHTSLKRIFAVLPILSSFISFVFASIVSVVSVLNAITLNKVPVTTGQVAQNGTTIVAENQATAELLSSPETKLLLALFLPALFIGFVFVYYIAYSTKVKYSD